MNQILEFLINRCTSQHSLSQHQQHTDKPAYTLCYVNLQEERELGAIGLCWHPSPNRAPVTFKQVRLNHGGSQSSLFSMRFLHCQIFGHKEYLINDQIKMLFSYQLLNCYSQKPLKVGKMRILLKTKTNFQSTG